MMRHGVCVSAMLAVALCAAWPGLAADAPEENLRVTPESAAELRLPTSSGLLVVGVEEGSPAGRVGVQLQDVLFQVNQFYVRDLDELGMALEPVRSGQGVMIGVARGNMRALAKIIAR